jgi:hypothetical protein
MPNTISTSSAATTSVTTTSASAGQGAKIYASDFTTMLSVLSQLTSHNHVFYDDYTTVCDCQCDCDCSRGTL